MVTNAMPRFISKSRAVKMLNIGSAGALQKYGFFKDMINYSETNSNTLYNVEDVLARKETYLAEKAKRDEKLKKFRSENIAKHRDLAQKEGRLGPKKIRNSATGTGRMDNRDLKERLALLKEINAMEEPMRQKGLLQ